jgi:signal peptidase I
VDLEFNFEKRYRLIREIIETLVLTALMFLVIRLAVQNFNIDGMSLEPTLHNQELVLVDKWSYMFHAPQRGDVIVFVAPPNPSQDYIKRVIGLPGDVVSVQGTKVTVNGKTLNESFIAASRQGNPFPSFTDRVIPPNDYFVLGDNRAGSSDSRDWGCVPRANIIGRAALVYWPLGQDNDGLLRNVSSYYKNIPAPSASLANSQNFCPVISQHPAEAQARVGALTNLPSSPSLADSILIVALPGVAVAYRRKRRVA